MPGHAGVKQTVRSQMKHPYVSNSTVLCFVTSVAMGDVNKGTKNDVLEGSLTYTTKKDKVVKEKYVATWVKEDQLYHVTAKCVMVNVNADATVTGTLNGLDVKLENKPGHPLLKEKPTPVTRPPPCPPPPCPPPPCPPPPCPPCPPPPPCPPTPCAPVPCAPVPCQPILKNKLCDDLDVAKKTLQLADVVVTEFREVNGDAEVLRADVVKRTHVNNKIIRSDVESVTKIVRQVLATVLKFENKLDNVIITTSNEIRQVINSGVTCEELKEELLQDIISNINLFANKYLEFKKMQEEELLLLREEVSQVETLICSNNVIIKKNMEQTVRDELKIKKLHVKAIFELVENITNTYKSLPKSLLDTCEFTSFSGALRAVNKELARCLPSPAKTEQLELKLLQSVTSGANMLREIFDHKCDKMVEVVDDLLTINKLQQQHVEATLLFDKTPKTTLLFNEINVGLAKMSKVTGLVIERLTRAKNDIVHREKRFQVEIDESVKFLSELNVPIECFGNNIDGLLQCELDRLPMTSVKRKGIVYAKKSFDALREFHSDVRNLENTLVVNLKGSASVSKDIMVDVYDGVLDIIGNEHYKNKVVAQYYAANTSSVSTLLDSSISKNIKAVIGNAFVLVGIGVRSLASEVVVSDLPILPLITCANLTLVEEDLNRILLKALGDIIIHSITGITKKVEETRKILTNLNNQTAQGIKDLSNIHHATQLKILKIVPKLLNDTKISLANFNNIIRFGLNLTLDAASKTLKC